MPSAINGRCLKCGYRLAWVVVQGKRLDTANLLTFLRVSVTGRPNTGIDEVGLYLAPANEENLQATIIRSKPMSIAKTDLKQEQYDALERALKGGKEFHCWAMMKNSRGKFKSMTEGDWVLFTAKGTGHFTYSARVIYKLESAALGSALWSVVSGLPWELLHSLDEVTPINIKKESLVMAARCSTRDGSLLAL